MHRDLISDENFGIFEKEELIINLGLFKESNKEEEFFEKIDSNVEESDLKLLKEAKVLTKEEFKKKIEEYIKAMYGQKKEKFKYHKSDSNLFYAAYAHGKALLAAIKLKEVSDSLYDEEYATISLYHFDKLIFEVFEEKAQYFEYCNRVSFISICIEILTYLYQNGTKIIFL